MPQHTDKEGLVPSAPHPGGLGKHGGGLAHFSSMDFKLGFWQIKMTPELQQYGGQPQVLQVYLHAIRVV